MKTIITIVLLAGFSCFARDVPGITNKVTEIDRDKDGKIDRRIVDTYRDGTQVMRTDSRLNQQGVMTVHSRAYCANGVLLMVEVDDDGDGTLEGITIFEPNSRDFEMFTRQADGSVKPISSPKLDSIKRQKAVADATMQKLFEGPEMTDQELSDLLEQHHRRIEAIKQEDQKAGD